MRKYILLLVVLCLQVAARGQTEWRYEYWFDDDRATVQTGTSATGSWQIQADVSGLSETIHALHMQVVGNGTLVTGVDSENGIISTTTAPVPSIPLTRYFIKTPVNATATGHYWFDTDDNVFVAPQSQGAMSIDVSHLNEGFHTLHYQLTGIGTSTVATRSFFKIFMPQNTKCHFWFDGDNAVRHTAATADGNVILDVSSLPDGYHTLHVLAEGGTTSFSTPITRPFVKIPQVEGMEYLTCLAIVDGQLFRQERVSPQGTLLNWNFDVSTLPQGFHSLLIQVVTPSGAASGTYQTFFVRETTHAEFAEMKCVYAIDGDEFNNEAGTLSNGTYHFDLDVSSLTDGLHRIAYMLSNGKGVETKVQCQFFMKIPVGGNGIQQYWYWLNDQSQNPTKVVLAERQDPYRLMDLLPVEQVPLRSQLFQFSVKNGLPVIYAKNEFHARFYDAAGRFTDMTRQYVDERVSQTITNAELLQTGRATTPRPEENAIKWYKLMAEAGDSLSFQLDRAATLQLFSPTGQEVLTVSGAASVSHNGIHAEENGTYYVALHDVTATSGSTVNLDYEHIDRYAVLRQDIATVGNGGPSTITFQGNGFDELTSVDFVLGTTIITSSELKTAGKATVSVKWDFIDAPLGQYKAVFHFAEGDVECEGCITVEEAVPVSTSSTVTYATQFLVSQGNTYSYKVKNHGNMTAYDMPMQLTVYATDADLLSWVAVDGAELTAFTPIETLIDGYVYGRQYQLTRTLRPNTTEPIIVKVKTNTTGGIYVDLDGVGGPSEAVTSIDPNDIYGYQDASGDKTLYDGKTDVWYTIEFENDPEFATAPAHDIYVSDQLDPQLFDLSTFSPTRIKIGDQEVMLTDENRAEQVVTIDMRPRINAIAQVAWNFDTATGLAEWHISSLDPMTMESATYILDGVLPVNTNGSGIGQLSFDISLKPNLPVNTQIPNHASIKFDDNDVILTTTWVNTIGGSMMKGDVNDDGDVDIADAVCIVNHVVGKPNAVFNVTAADANNDGDVDIADAVHIVNYIVGKINALARKLDYSLPEPQ